MPVVPVAITAKNEAQSIGACLDSLRVAIDVASAACVLGFELCVVVDDSRDATRAIATARGVRVIDATGGKVEAQRAAVAAYPGAPFVVLSDADVVVAPDTIAGLASAMVSPEVEVAFPPKWPLAPRRRTPLARALHLYNARRGFSAQRTWFSGKLFAIRRWAIPQADEIARRASRLSESRFLDLAAPLRVDDVYLSRAIVHAHGPAALHETTRGAVHFRAPETLGGMYLYYRRMRRELARIDALFPELAPAARAYGARAPSPSTLGERAALAIFDAALLLCRARYRAEQLAVDRLGCDAGDPWPSIAETK